MSKQDYKRNFKGVWIPKHIWLNRDLSFIEKCFLVEIDSLDNDDGCYASNKHFSDFFHLSKSRCSQIINALKDKGFIKISYEKDGKEIKGRAIKVLRKLNTPIKFSKEGCLENAKPPIKFSKEGYLENAKENNTYINNTRMNNTYRVIDHSLFEKFWKAYPKKVGKKKAILAFEKINPDEELTNVMIKKIEEYKKTKQWQKENGQYIPNPTTWLNQGRWEDELTTEVESPMTEQERIMSL